MPPQPVENNPAQLFQPLPVQGADRPLNAFEPLRQAQLARTAPPAEPAAPPRPAGNAPVPLRSVNAPPPPPPPRPARIEIAEKDPLAQRDRVPERLFQLLNETRGRTEFAALARRLELARELARPEAAAPVPAAAGPAERLPLPPAPPAAGPIRELSEIAPGSTRSGILRAADLDADLAVGRAREVLERTAVGQTDRREAGIGAPSVVQTLIDETV